MPIKKSGLDEIVQISRAGELNKVIFEDLKDDPQKGFAEVQKFCTKFKDRLQDFDARWVRLCKDDVDELTIWADRMRSIQERLGMIESQLQLGRIVNWDFTISSMGNLQAHRVAIEQTLALNEESNSSS